MRSFLELLQLPPFSSFLIYTRWPGHFEAVAERRRYIYQPNPGLSVYNQWLLPPLAPALDAVACSSEWGRSGASERVQSKRMEEIHAFYVIVQPKVGFLSSSMRKTVALLRT